MTLKKALIDREVFDARRPLILYRVDNPIDHQKRVPVGDHFHDPMNIDLSALLPVGGRIGHYPSFFLPRRCSATVCLIKSAIGTAGIPDTVVPAATSRISPAFAAIRAPVPICR